DVRSNLPPQVGLVRADHLLVERLDLRRQEPVQAEPVALVFGEGGALVQALAVQEIRATRYLALLRRHAHSFLFVLATFPCRARRTRRPLRPHSGRDASSPRRITPRPAG